MLDGNSKIVQACETTRYMEYWIEEYVEADHIPFPYPLHPTHQIILVTSTTAGSGMTRSNIPFICNDALTFMYVPRI